MLIPYSFEKPYSLSWNHNTQIDKTVNKEQAISNARLPQMSFTDCNEWKDFISRNTGNGRHKICLSSKNVMLDSHAHIFLAVFHPLDKMIEIGVSSVTNSLYLINSSSRNLLWSNFLAIKNVCAFIQHQKKCEKFSLGKLESSFYCCNYHHC